MTATITAILVAGAVAVTACSDGPASASLSEEERLQAASQGLCDAQVLASEGRVRDAASVFQAETHDYLHALAGKLQSDDPAAAAGLLEAKQRVEQALARGADPPGTQVLLSELQRALGDAAAAAGLPEPLCREGAT
jgi:hypothetical protein